MDMFDKYRKPGSYINLSLFQAVLEEYSQNKFLEIPIKLQPNIQYFCRAVKSSSATLELDELAQYMIRVQTVPVVYERTTWMEAWMEPCHNKWNRQRSEN